jgi:hypothetical protein
MKNFLFQEFEMKNLKEFTYFFGIQGKTITKEPLALVSLSI